MESFITTIISFICVIGMATIVYVQYTEQQRKYESKKGQKNG